MGPPGPHSEVPGAAVHVRPARRRRRRLGSIRRGHRRAHPRGGHRPRRLDDLAGRGALCGIHRRRPAPGGLHPGTAGRHCAEPHRLHPHHPRRLRRGVPEGGPPGDRAAGGGHRGQLRVRGRIAHGRAHGLLSGAGARLPGSPERRPRPGRLPRGRRHGAHRVGAARPPGLRPHAEAPDDLRHLLPLPAADILRRVDLDAHDGSGPQTRALPDVRRTRQRPSTRPGTTGRLPDHRPGGMGVDLWPGGALLRQGVSGDVGPDGGGARRRTGCLHTGVGIARLPSGPAGTGGQCDQCHREHRRHGHVRPRRGLDLG